MTAPFKILTFEEFETDALAIMAPPKQFTSKFKGVLWGQIKERRAKYDWLIKGLVAARELAFLAGPQQSGKSFFVTDLAARVALGRDFWGRKVRQGAVVYIAAESSTGVISLRLPAYVQKHGLSFDDNVPFLTLTKAPNFFADEQGVKDLIAEINAFGLFVDQKVELVVVDTFSASSAGMDEISGKSVSLVRDRMKMICDECGAAVLVVHHMNGTGERVRGHSSLTADADSVLLVNWDRKHSDNPRSPGEIKKDADGRNVRLVSTQKIKEGASNIKIRFVLEEIILGYDEDGEKITSCVVTQANGVEEVEQQASEKLPRMSTKMSTVFRALVEALKKNGRPAPTTVEGAAGAECVTLSDWRDELSALIAGEDEDPEKLKERAKKARDLAMFDLIDRKYIKKRGDWIWRTGRPVPGIDRNDPPPPSEPTSHPEAKDLDSIGW